VPSKKRLGPPSSGEKLREETVRSIAASLNAVVGFAQLLALDASRVPGEMRAGYAEQVRAAARKLMRLVPQVAGIDVTPPSLASGTHAAARELPPDEVASQAPSPEELAAKGARPRVLVVDADDPSRELLAAQLQGRGFDLFLASSSAQGLEVARDTPPDLVFLDAAATDAFETSRTLKATDQYLPVVFVAPIGDGGARLRALEAGAEQYLEKPVSGHELRARVRNLLNIRKSQRELAVQNEQLKRLQAFKDEMAALMVHDLKSPLSAISMNLDVALVALPEGLGDVRGALEDCRLASARLFRMIANLLDIARSEDGRLVVRPTPVDLAQVLGKIAEDHATEARLRDVELAFVCDAKGTFELDPDLIGRVIENLLENGLRYARTGGHLRLAVREAGDVLELRVANDGPPIPPEARAHIFEKYGQVVTSTGTARVNRGLGLYFCRVAAQAHGGAIDLVDEPGMTTCFRVTLARRPA
jgi:signal transduction histidine kinase